MTAPTRVTVGVSGGVDSAVAAMLLKRAGLAVSGVFMRNWDDDGPESGCHADTDRRDALAACCVLGIPFHSISFAREYRESVFSHFLEEYRAGRTPNPDVLCNREIKFGNFLAAARAAGAERIATGHYARIARGNGRWMLLRARDAAKDQTYFLHMLDQEQLAASLLPLGDLHKSEVRTLAREAGLPVAAKKDSTGICFIGKRDFRTFLARFLPARPGALRTPRGDTVGEHAGAHFYTPGQRAGLHIGGRSGGTDAPWYVVGKDVASNIVYVAQGNDSAWLQSRSLSAGNAHWISGAPPATEFTCTARMRHRQPLQACRVTVGQTCTVRFDAPQRAIAAGQSVVFYSGETCLGGAVIDATDAPTIGTAA